MVAIVGALRLGQVDADEHPRLPRPADRRHLRGRRPRRPARSSPTTLAELRREHFGFIFQRYHLLSDLTALGNVEMPAIYAGVAGRARARAARRLLARLGLGRAHGAPAAPALRRPAAARLHRPRAHERRAACSSPTSRPARSTRERRGDACADPARAQAARATRSSSSPTTWTWPSTPTASSRSATARSSRDRRAAPRSQVDRAPACRVPPTGPRRGCAPKPGGPLHARPSGMAVRAMAAHKLRTVPDHARHHHRHRRRGQRSWRWARARSSACSRTSRGLGTNTLEIFPGTGFGDHRALRRDRDARPCAMPQALASQPYADSVTPTRDDQRHDRASAMSTPTAQVNGVGDRYFRRARQRAGSRPPSSTRPRASRSCAQDVGDRPERAATCSSREATPIPIGRASSCVGSVPAAGRRRGASRQGGFGGGQDSTGLPALHRAVRRRFARQTSRCAALTVRVTTTTPMGGGRRRR